MKILAWKLIFRLRNSNLYVSNIHGSEHLRFNKNKIEQINLTYPLFWILCIYALI